MIPDKIRMKDCVGMYAILENSITDGTGHCITSGSIVRIRSYGRALDIETKKCPCCGQYTIVRDVKKSELTLLEDAYVNKAVKHRQTEVSIPISGEWNKFDFNNPNSYPPFNKEVRVAWLDCGEEKITSGKWRMSQEKTPTQFVERKNYWELNEVAYAEYDLAEEEDIVIVAWCEVPNRFPIELRY